MATSRETRIRQAPLIDIRDKPSAAEGRWPAVNGAGRPVLQAGERVLFDGKAFVELFGLIAGTTRYTSFWKPPESGFAVITDHRVVYGADKYDIGFNYGNVGVGLLATTGAKALAKNRRGGHVAIGQIPYANVRSVAKRFKKTVFSGDRYLYFDVELQQGGVWRMQLNCVKADTSLADAAAAAVAAVRQVQLPAMSATVDGLDAWLFPGAALLQ